MENTPQLSKMKIKSDGLTTTVIMVNNRYFVKYENKRIQTGWTLTSAKTYHYENDLIKDFHILKRKKYKPEIHYIMNFTKLETK